jgi:hypothetical protein
MFTTDGETVINGCLASEISAKKEKKKRSRFFTAP